jgi:curved DNA-binding protein CbpA
MHYHRPKSTGDAALLVVSIEKSAHTTIVPKVLSLFDRRAKLVGYFQQDGQSASVCCRITSIRYPRDRRHSGMTDVRTNRRKHPLSVHPDGDMIDHKADPIPGGKMEMINRAYGILMNPASRARHDTTYIQRCSAQSKPSQKQEPKQEPSQQLVLDVNPVFHWFHHIYAKLSDWNQPLTQPPKKPWLEWPEGTGFPRMRPSPPCSWPETTRAFPAAENHVLRQPRSRQTSPKCSSPKQKRARMSSTRQDGSRHPFVSSDNDSDSVSPSRPNDLHKHRNVGSTKLQTPYKSTADLIDAFFKQPVPLQTPEPHFVPSKRSSNNIHTKKRRHKHPAQHPSAICASPSPQFFKPNEPSVPRVSSTYSVISCHNNIPAGEPTYHPDPTPDPPNPVSRKRKHEEEREDKSEADPLSDIVWEKYSRIHPKHPLEIKRRRVKTEKKKQEHQQQQLQQQLRWTLSSDLR